MVDSYLREVSCNQRQGFPNIAQGVVSIYTTASPNTYCVPGVKAEATLKNFREPRMISPSRVAGQRAVNSRFLSMTDI